MDEYHTKTEANDEASQATELARAIRDACVTAALGAYENARVDGLCHEGAWEVAVGAIRRLNVERFVRQWQGQE